MRRMLQSVTAGLLVLAGLTLTSLAPPATGLAADATVTVCDWETFSDALDAVQADGGGTLTIDCSDPITFSSQKEITSDVTIIGDGAVLDGNDSTRLFVVTEGARLALTGLTLQNGNAGSGDGGAIVNAGTLSITGSAFSDNTADDFGGAINNTGTLSITGSAFSNNGAEVDGFISGGAINNTGTLSITGSAFDNNSVGRGGPGGAILSSGTLEVTASNFVLNSGSNGGAIATINGGTLEVTASSFSLNNSGNGGAISNGAALRDAGTVTITASTFSGNTAGTGGAFDNFRGGTATITASTFNGNSAIGGGAVYNRGDSLEIAASTFSDNRAVDDTFGTGDGGAIENVSSLEITASTFSGNRVESEGEVIHNNASGTVTFGASILANSSETDNCNLDGTITSAGYNLSDDESCNLNATGDQQGSDVTIDLGEIQDNGGPTHTMLPGEDSDAIDAADCTVSSEHDQRGAPRPATDCDIGSVEVGASGAVQIFAFISVGGVVEEGNAADLFAMAYGPDNADLDYALDCEDDGSYDTVVTGGGTNARFSCTIPDDGVQTVGLQVCDGNDSGNCDTATAEVTVLEVAPVVEIPVVDPSTSNEGSPVTASAEFDATDAESCTVDYGEGDGPQDGTIENNTCTGPEHTYADNADDGYTVTVQVCDEETCASNSTTHTVNNVAPTVNTPSVSPSSPAEGDRVDLSASFSDPGTGDEHSCTIDWGDETSDTGTVGQANDTCTASHSYVDDGSYTVEVCVSDGDDEGCDMLTVTVSNVAPTVNAPQVNPSPSDEGESVVASATFSDPGTSDSHTCTVDYGDGSSAQVGTIDGNTCTGPAHTYADDDDYDVAIEICDVADAESCGSNSSEHSVENVAPTIVVIETNSPVQQGQPAIITVNASDPAGENDPLMYRFDCESDGTYDIGPQDENTAECLLDPGQFRTTITVEVNDGDGGVRTASVEVEQTLTLCSNAYTGEMSGPAMGDCPAGTVALTVPASEPVTFCVGSYTGEISWSPMGECNGDSWMHLVPDNGPLAYCESIYTGGLRYNATGQCTTNERPGVVPG